MSMTIEERGVRAPVTEALPQRRFGKTEERVPVLGLGTGPGGIGLPEVAR